MRRIVVVLFALLPSLLFAGVIVKKSGENIEDVTIKSITDSEVIYTNRKGAKMTLPKSEVSAVLYDDGRYEEIKYQAPEPEIVTDVVILDQVSSKTKEKDTPQSNDNTKRKVPKVCYDEGQKAYKQAYDAAFNKALKQGYSKGQAYSIAGEAGVEAKKQAIDECYETRVVQGIY